MAQTPHQQIQVVQQQPVSSTQLQQLYFPHQQVLFPGNIALQQAPAGQPTLQSVAPNRTFSNTSVGVLPKSIQSSALPVQSIANQRQLGGGGHQITTQAAGATFQPSNFLGSFATLSPLPVGYQWATNCYQQNPIIIRSQHPNIYVQPQAAIQLPISAGQQIVTPTSYASNPHIQLETQTIATQTLVPSVTAVNSGNAFIQLDPNIPVTKPSPSTSPSSSTPEVSNVQIQSQANQPLLLSTQSLTHHILEESSGILASVTETEITEIQSAEIQREFMTPEKEQTPSPQKPAVLEQPKAGMLLANADAACTMTVSSTTPTTVASISHLHSFVSNLGKRTIAVVNTPSQVEDSAPPSVVEVGACDATDVKDVPSMLSAVVILENIADPLVKSEHFSPQKPIKNPYLGPLKDKQPQKAIVKPQMLSHVKDSSVKQEERETFLESLKSLADSPPKTLSPEEPDSMVVADSVEDTSPPKKLKVVRGRGRPRGRHGKFKQAERRRSLRQQVMESQIEILEVIERKTPPASEVSTSHSSEETSSSVLPESHKSEPPASISASSIASDLVEDIEPKIDVKMPKTPPNAWSVEEVFEFIQGFPGCFDHAESFKSQEIDGQALLLIKLDHLMTGMSMKLGPAVKLMAHIRCMKEKLS